MGDLFLYWNSRIGSADLRVVSDDLEADAGLRTSVMLSIYTDRRADDGDVLPSEESGKRGWWGDDFLRNENDRFGSKLWLLDRAKATADIRPLAERYVRESLKWLLDDGVAESVEVETAIEVDRLYYLITIAKPDGELAEFKFPHVWEGEAARVDEYTIDEAAALVYLITEGGDTLVTESGDALVTE